MANGKIVYTNLSGATVTISFTYNYSFGHKTDFINMDDNQRALDGSLKSYKGPTKRRYMLPFNAMTKTNKESMETLIGLSIQFELYLDSGNAKTIDGYFVEKPEFESIPYFSNGICLWRTALSIEEI